MLAAARQAGHFGHAALPPARVDSRKTKVSEPARQKRSMAAWLGLGLGLGLRLGLGLGLGLGLARDEAGHLRVHSGEASSRGHSEAGWAAWAWRLLGLLGGLGCTPGCGGSRCAP